MGVTRRQFLELFGLAAATALLGGCGGGAVFNPAVTGWFSSFTSGVAATIVADQLSEGAFEDGWADLWPAVDRAAQQQADQGWPYRSGAYGQRDASAILVGYTQAGPWNPATDRLVVCHERRGSVVFPPWAWQGLAMLMHAVKEGAEGDTAVRLETLVARSILPVDDAEKSGYSPLTRSAFMAYPTRDGSVELVLGQDGDGRRLVTVSVLGLPTASSEVTEMSFMLPATST